MSPFFRLYCKWWTSLVLQAQTISLSEFVDILLYVAASPVIVGPVQPVQYVSLACFFT
jgi:hypothetical protein